MSKSALNRLGSEQTRGRFSKRYGDVVVESDAHLQQGDIITQDVNVNGELHLHVHSPVHLVSAAGGVIQFLDVSAKLKTVGDQLQLDFLCTRKEEVSKLLPLTTSLRLVILQLMHELTSSLTDGDDSRAAKVRALIFMMFCPKDHLWLLMK